MKTACVLLFYLTTAAPAQADLRFDSRFDARALPGPALPLVARFGSALLDMLPRGETRTMVKGDVVRTEVVRSSGALPPRGTIFVMRGPTLIVMDPLAKTYYVTSRPEMVAQVRPRVTIVRSGDFASVDGFRAERATVTMQVDLPLVAAAPPGFPASLTLEGEVWTVDQLKPYASTLRLAATSLLGSQGAPAIDGFVVRQRSRNPQLGYEIETTITHIVEGPVDDQLFEIPSGYREVPVPAAPFAPR